MSKKGLSLETARKLYENMILSPENLPVSFVYNDVKYNGLENMTLTSKETSPSEKGEKVVYSYHLDDILDVVLIAEYCIEYGETEYTLWFENNSEQPSGVIRDVYLIDKVFDGDDPLLRGCLGDHENYYAAYEYKLNEISKYFRSDNGRATHIVFPYFDLVHGDGGTLLALGWAGTWETIFSAHEDKTTVKAKTNITLNGALLPGEKIRTGLVVMLPYKGRNADNATNLWREWFMKYNLPKADAQGTPLRPFSTSFWALDTGLPNSDGSISERYFTWQPTLEKIIKEDIVSDFRWFDAGWYFDPSNQTVEADWWGTIGTWELDTVKWPDKTFRESNEACHAVGMKVLVWFEPERVTHVEELAKNYGYNPDWAATDDGFVYTSNLGNDECLNWTLNRIIKMMDENAVDMYREDNNSNPAAAWRIWDERYEKKYGISRKGINENKSIQGHYKLWDGIIKYCAENGKCTFVDSCASGGGRNDIESMRRGFPLMRSDADRTTSSRRLSQTASLCKWLPFHGSNTKETTYELEPSVGSGSDEYVSRASLLPIYNYGESFTHNTELDYDLMRKNIAEWKMVRDLLIKDFYVLTPWHHDLDRCGWSSFAYDDEEQGRSLLLAFRMEECPHDTFIAKMPFIEVGASYTVENVDTGEIKNYSGIKLLDGFTITLDKPRSCAMYLIIKN